MASPDSRLKQGSALRVAVIGAGVIGLSCALALLRRGAAVSVYEAGSPGSGGATPCAAGMLGVGFEAAEGGDAPHLGFLFNAVTPDEGMLLARAFACHSMLATLARISPAAVVRPRTRGTAMPPARSRPRWSRWGSASKPSRT